MKTFGAYVINYFAICIIKKSAQCKLNLMYIRYRKKLVSLLIVSREVIKMMNSHFFPYSIHGSSIARVWSVVDFQSKFV